jgi:predicted signal transduction protein with EAL and GGDEF domain
VRDAAALIHNADLAMYHAKQSGEGHVRQFEATMVPAAI